MLLPTSLEVDGANVLILFFMRLRSVSVISPASNRT